MTNLRVLLLLILCICLSACGGTPKLQPQTAPVEEKLLTEADFRQAVAQYLRSGGGPVVSTYDIILTDLNGDYRPEGLVMMNTPFKTWCHLAGCTLLVFEARDNDILLNSRIAPIRGPLFIHDTGHNWKSIVTRQDGINRDARYIELINTGTGYPAFALNAQDYYGSSPHSGMSFFY